MKPDEDLITDAIIDVVDIIKNTGYADYVDVTQVFNLVIGYQYTDTPNIIPLHDTSCISNTLH